MVPLGLNQYNELQKCLDNSRDKILSDFRYCSSIKIKLTNNIAKTSFDNIYKK